MFQIGWFNHQPDIRSNLSPRRWLTTLSLAMEPVNRLPRPEELMSELMFFKIPPHPRKEGLMMGILTRWWFQIFFLFSPLPGEMIQFD